MGQANVTEFQAVTFTRTLVGRAWRWRSELGLLSGGGAGFLECWHCVGLDATGAAIGGGALLAVALPWPRRFMVRRFWSVVSRHRLQSAWWQLRLHNRAGGLPLVLWIRPTPVGERAWVACRAGLCADDFTKAAPEMAAACAAREVRVTASRRYSQLLTIDVIRRDPLAPGKVVPSLLADAGTVPAVADWLADPDPESLGYPVPSAPRWPDVSLGGE